MYKEKKRKLNQTFKSTGIKEVGLICSENNREFFLILYFHKRRVRSRNLLIGLRRSRSQNLPPESVPVGTSASTPDDVA